MSSSTGREAGGEAPGRGGDGAPGRATPPVPRRHGNGFATASLAMGAAGVSLVTVVPAVVLGVMGLRRARRSGWRGRGSGLARSCLGIALAIMWSAVGLVLVPHLVRAADPGCTVYKGRALTAYNRVITDLNAGHTRARIARDLSRAIALLDEAAGRSHAGAASRSLTRLSRQLHRLLTDIRTGAVVPDAALAALNRDASRADAACGTLRV